MPASNALIQALLEPHRYPHAVSEITLLETHISWILLTGKYAYKIKKPVDLGFLDFTQLQQRQHYCHEELRLNQRLAPQLYLEVLPITGTAQDPQWNGDGTTIEYAVKMQQFPQSALLEQVLAREELSHRHLDQLAHDLAHFHQTTDIAATDSDYGAPAAVAAPMEENIQQITANIDSEKLPQLQRLQTWTRSQLAQLKPLLEHRKRKGYIRECHGDLHLGNMVLLEDKVVLFDCLEFNPYLRWIDVMSEVAFLTMDLASRQQHDSAYRVLNNYLEYTGDYAGLALLPLYQCYRALVRAKVASIRAKQSTEVEAQQRLWHDYQVYIELAETYTCSNTPTLYITHGLSGSGKTTISSMLAETHHIIRVRSDVERKRLYGLDPRSSSHSMLNRHLYRSAANTRTYTRLADLARTLIQSGYSVVVDAAFLHQFQRLRFHELAQALKVNFVILEIHAKTETLRQRLQSRQRLATDASEADLSVLRQQLDTHEALDAMELEHAISIDTDRPVHAILKTALQLPHDTRCRA